jgi:hypothetical protein
MAPLWMLLVGRAAVRRHWYLILATGLLWSLLGPLNRRSRRAAPRAETPTASELTPSASRIRPNHRSSRADADGGRMAPLWMLLVGRAAVRRHWYLILATGPAN